MDDTRLKRINDLFAFISNRLSETSEISCSKSKTVIDEIACKTKTTNDIIKKLIPKSKPKPTGKIVWDDYDGNQLQNIESRCEQEVCQNIEIYTHLQEIIKNNEY